MTAVTGVKTGSVGKENRIISKDENEGFLGGEKTQFRTQMINGKAQIYFDALGQSNTSHHSPMGKSFFLDEAPIITKPKRNIRTTNTTRLPEQMKPQPAPPPSQKPPPARPPTKPMRKGNKVTFSDNQSQAGVFMTMEEIAELVKAAKESTQPAMYPTGDYQGNIFEKFQSIIECTFAEPPSAPQLPNEFHSMSDILPSGLTPISPRQEALGQMADKKRQKWMREKGEYNGIILLSLGMNISSSGNGSNEIRSGI